MCLVDIFYCFLWPEKQSSVGNQAGVVVVKSESSFKLWGLAIVLGFWCVCVCACVCTCVCDVCVWHVYVCICIVCVTHRRYGTIPYLGTEVIDHSVC